MTMMSSELAEPLRVSSVYLPGPAVALLGGMAIVEKALFWSGAIDEMRGELPEPFDLADHYGNVTVSFGAGVLGGLTASWLWIGYSKRFRGQAPTLESTKRAARVGAFITGLAANLVGEFFMSPQPNAADTAYGMAGAMLGPQVLRYVTIPEQQVGASVAQSPLRL